MPLCLSMIVKNDSQSIGRCLRSVRPLIDSYSISDAGSTDDTMAIIRKELEGIPGVLKSGPKKDIAANRNLALKGCTGKHIILLNADETVENPSGNVTLPEVCDGLTVRVTFPGEAHWMTRIIRNDPKWNYAGDGFESIAYDGQPTIWRLFDIKLFALDNSLRKTAKQKLANDVAILASRPATTRNVMYQAQTFLGLGRIEEAIDKYLERAKMGGWEEEVYCSLWKAAELKWALSCPFDEIASAFYAAHTYRPSRLEALASLCRLLRTRNRWEQIYNLTLLDPKPTWDKLFVDRNSEWLILEEHAIASNWLGKLVEARDYFRRVLGHEIPNDARERTKNNLSLCESQIAKASK